MTTDVEILAHVTAPAMSSDDARYRSLASAYLAFVPGARTTVPSCSQQAKEPSHAPGSCSQKDAAGTRLPGTLSLESPQLSFASVLDNAGSPRVTMVVAAQPSEETPEKSQARLQMNSSQVEDSDSWPEPPSTIPDSLPLNDVRLSGFSSPSRLIEHFLGDFESTQTESQSSSDADASQQEQAWNTQDSSSLDELEVVIPMAPDDQLAHTSSGPHSSGRSDGSIIPATPARPSDLSHTEEQPEHEAGNVSVIEDTILEDGDGVVKDTPGFAPLRKRTLSQVGARADSEPVSPKRHRRPSSDDPMTPPRLLRRSSDGSLGLTMDDALERGRKYLRHFNPPYLYMIELHSPDPRVSNDIITPADLVTPLLDRLTTDLDTCSQPTSQEQGPSSRFDSVELRRQISPFERGYWLVDCSTWTDDLPQLMWCSLAKFVSVEGVAGWGTWCRRDEHWRWIRVYCFGHVARHLYYLLYASSYRKLKMTRASWIDAAGEVVLSMDGA